MTESLIPTGLSVYQFAGFQPGPKLIILGAVHGNETCGTEALQRLNREIDSGEVTINKGTLTILPITNPLAYQFQRRHGDRNLNRNMSRSDEPRDFDFLEACSAISSTALFIPIDKNSSKFAMLA